MSGTSIYLLALIQRRQFGFYFLCMPQLLPGEHKEVTLTNHTHTPTHPPTPLCEGVLVSNESNNSANNRSGGGKGTEAIINYLLYNSIMTHAHTHIWMC